MPRKKRLLDYNWNRTVFDPVLVGPDHVAEMNRLRELHPERFPVPVLRPYIDVPYKKVKVLFMTDFPPNSAYKGYSIGHMTDSTGSPATLKLLKSYNQMTGSDKRLLKVGRWAKEEGWLMPFYNWTNEPSYLYERLAYRTVQTLHYNFEDMVFVFHGKRSEELVPLVDNPDHLVIRSSRTDNVLPMIVDYYRRRNRPMNIRM